MRKLIYRIEDMFHKWKKRIKRWKRRRRFIKVVKKHASGLIDFMSIVHKFIIKK